MDNVKVPNMLRKERPSNPAPMSRITMETPEGKSVIERTIITIEEVTQLAERLGLPREADLNKADIEPVAPVDDTPQEIIDESYLQELNPPRDANGEIEEEHTVWAYVECPECNYSETRSALPWFRHLPCNTCGTRVFLKPVNADGTSDSAGITLEGSQRYFTAEERARHKESLEQQYGIDNVSTNPRVLAAIDMKAKNGTSGDLARGFTVSELKAYADDNGISVEYPTKHSLSMAIHRKYQGESEWS